MADLSAIIQAKNAADAKWKEDRQAERETITAVQDDGITQITTDPATYARYLTMQGDNPTYSPGNIALVMMKMPEATVFGTAERWRGMGRSVDSAERGCGVKIFARTPKGYDLTDAYDIGQTVGREPQALQLTNNSKEMETALASLLKYSPVPVANTPGMAVPAFYDEQSMELNIDPGYSDIDAFAAIATEIAHARFHERGKNRNYDRRESELDAQSISYVLCRRFKINRELPDLSNLPNLYQDWSVESRKKILDGIQDMSKMIGGSIERDIAPPQRTIPITRRPPARQGR